MGVTLIVDDPQLAPLLSGIHLWTSEGWKVHLAARGHMEICWYNLHEETNPCLTHGSSVAYLLSYSRP